MDKQKEFRDLLRRKIEESGYSLNQIARKTGISAAQISRTINGERWLSAKALVKIAPYLKMTPSEILIAAGYPLDYDKKESTPPDIRRIARAAEKLTPEERKIWIESSWQIGKALFPKAFKEEEQN